MDNPDRITYFAATDSRGKRTPFGIKKKDRNRHMYVIGKTGMGKSTLLENMAIQDLRNGEGMAFIDPHGSAVETLLKYIPEERIKDVVYFAPFDLDQPIAFNIMEDVGYDKRHLVVSGLMATFKKIWEDAWSARMEYILTNTLLALLEYPDATLLGVNRMYTDKNYRKKVVDNITDPVVKSFWVDEYAKYTDKFAAEATPAIQNKIGQFTGNPLIRNIIGQPKSSFDIRELMDNKKILLINLSKGLVGDTNMRLLGSMLTTRIFLAAMSRAELPPEQLKETPSFYFYVDEFQNFANQTFSEILSEARKYNLNLIIAHQYVEQMEEEVAAAVFGNVGTTIAFRVGPFDAEKLEVVFAPKFTPEDLVNMGFAQIYLSLMIDGIGSPPFSAITLPPIEPPQRIFQKEVIEASRKQFGALRADIEAAVNKELMSGTEAALPDPNGAPRLPRPAYAPQGNGDRPRSTTDRPRSNGNGGGYGSGGNGGSSPPRPERSDRAPQQERPRAEYPERPRTDHAERPRSQDRTHTPPPSSGKSADDLRAILRTMAAKEEKPQPKATGGLKDALKGVLETSPAPVRTPQAREESRPEKVPQSDASAGKKPFEVPQDALQAIFKEPL